MSNARLLIVHTSPSSLALIRSMLYTSTGRMEEATSDREAVHLLERAGANLVLAGVDPSDPDALELLAYVRRKHPQIPVLLLFTTPDPDRAREALQRGAAGVLRFPLPATELRAAVSQALEQTPSTPGVPAIQERINGNGSHSNGSDSRPLSGRASERTSDGDVLVGLDPNLQQAIELAAAVSPMRTPVLILGEAGAGKTSLAHTIHRQSARKDAPFVAVDCNVLRDAQLERELFGQKTGGFADRGTEIPGKLAQAHGGTIYLSEVATLSAEVQYRLLRLLQHMEYEPVHSTQTVRIDVRLIFGSSEDLASLVAQGRIRQDLYERISGVCLKLPPLRERGADIEMVAQHFRARHARTIGKEVVGFTPEALVMLAEYRWPGNVRELQNVVERAVVACRGPMIAPSNIALVPDEPRPTPYARPQSHRFHAGLGIRPLKEALEEPEKQIILQALEALNWNRQETARVLDINRTTLYKKMKKYGLLANEPAWMN
jgi:DNA-binding NtrC family response regulator